MTLPPMPPVLPCRGCRSGIRFEVYRGELGWFCGECTGDAADHPRTADDWVGGYCFCGRLVFRPAHRSPRGHPSCSDACRRAEENELRRPRRRRGPRPVSCDGCDTTFTATRADARWCTPACRQRGYRRRVGATATPALTAP